MQLLPVIKATDSFKNLKYWVVFIGSHIEKYGETIKEAR